MQGQFRALQTVNGLLGLVARAEHTVEQAEFFVEKLIDPQVGAEAGHRRCSAWSLSNSCLRASLPALLAAAMV